MGSCTPDAKTAAAAERLRSGRFAYRFLKRLFDMVFSAAVLILFSWLFAIVAIAIKIDDPQGPVLFGQERIGRDGRRFRMWKFRSMCNGAEAKLAALQEQNEKGGPVFKMADDPRITRVGHFIRKTSIDELPQFLNVFLGQIPLRIIKMRPEFSVKEEAAFALPAKSSTNKSRTFSQVAATFAARLRTRRAAGLHFNLANCVEARFLAKPVFGAVRV